VKHVGPVGPLILFEIMSNRKLFSSSWDTYLAMTDVQIHWFSIVNSVIVVFFLAGILSMIIVKTLRRDIARYNQEETVRWTCFALKYLNIRICVLLGRCNRRNRMEIVC